MKIIKKLGKKILEKLLAFAILPLLLLTGVNSASAVGARLFLSPSQGTYPTGSYIPVTVLVDSGGNPTNVYRAVLTYSQELLPVSLSSGGSICELWITQTSTTLECGTLDPYKGRAGKLATVNFLAKSAGNAVVSIASGNVKKADGAGTEILSDRGAAEFTIQDLPAGTPTITSSTHPNQNAWYQERTASLSWGSDAQTEGFSYLLDKDPATIPPDTSLGTATAKTYPDLIDGAYFLHIKAKTQEGWSFTNHFRLQIDGTAPLPFKIVSDVPAGKVFRAPLLSFFTTDATSGVAYYELSLDGGAPERTGSPYRFTRIMSGRREVVVKAYDQAGNSQEAKLTLIVVGVSSPVVIRPTENEVIPLFGSLPVQLKTNATGTVEVKVDGKNPLTLAVMADQEVTTTYNRLLAPGNHEFTATYISADGIESAPTKVNFQVTPWTVSLGGFPVPGYIFYPILILVLVVLGLLLKRYLKKRQAKRAQKSENGKKEEQEKAKPAPKTEE